MMFIIKIVKSNVGRVTMGASVFLLSSALQNASSDSRKEHNSVKILTVIKSVSTGGISLIGCLPGASVHQQTGTVSNVCSIL